MRNAVAGAVEAMLPWDVISGVTLVGIHAGRRSRRPEILGTLKCPRRCLPTRHGASGRCLAYV